MKIKWVTVENIEEYVKKTLAAEADDIPQSLINEAPWILVEVKSSKIHPNAQMIDDHNQDPIHISRKDNFINMIKNGEAILPLIVLGKNLSLVDGYARFRAFRDLEITKIQVFKQNFVFNKKFPHSRSINSGLINSD